MRVKNKLFIVTGAASGIGAALTRELISRDARVAAVDIKKGNLISLQKSIDNANTLSIHVLDITDKLDVHKQIEHIRHLYGQIDGLINNAGIIQPFIKVQDLDYMAIDKVMNVNFYGTLYMTKTVLPELLDRPEAHIVNISSMGGFLPVPGQSVYGASKAAVKLLTEGLYAELKDTNVRVSLVFPGATETNITTNSGVETPALSNDAAKKFPALKAEEVAQIIVNGIEKNKLRIYTGRDSKMMDKLYRLSPTFATNFIAKQMKSLLGTTQNLPN